MDEQTWLARRFEDNRPHLRKVAYRMLGSPSEADDAVQEAWLRLARTDAADVDNLGGWLTTVVARICLDMLRTRASRREAPFDIEADSAEPDLHDEWSRAADPEREAVLADSVGIALLVVLDSLAPPERVAFVLHDLFDVPFPEIADILDRSPAAVRQLASRARRRVHEARTPEATRSRRRELVAAFLAASRSGDFQALLALLDPDVVLRADQAAVATGAQARTQGAQPVAQTFAGRAKAARPALVDGAAALVWAHGGQPQVVFAFDFADERIVAIELVADRARLDAMEIEFLDSAGRPLPDREEDRPGAGR